MKKSYGFFLCLLIFSFKLFSQTTINFDKNNPSSSVNSNFSKHKILLAPFEYKMYMSDIDHVINAATNKSQKEIRWNFQDKIDEVLYKKFKAKYEVVSLVEDTAKFKHDLKLIYGGLNYNYDKVPSQKNYTAPKSDYKREGKIKEGQIAATPNNGLRFMNAKLRDKSLLEKLNKKHQADVFLFINQLDIKSSNATSASFGSEQLRKVVLHYTVFSLQGQEINSGIAETTFPKSQNDPDIITVNYIEKALDEIYQRVDKALNPASSVTGN